MASDDAASQPRVDGRADGAGGSASEKRRGRRGDRAVTLVDVGRLAGVSPSTVSRVVNNSIPVSPELREAIERAIMLLGYVPNRAARSLAARRSDSIGVVIHEPASQSVSDPFITQLLLGIARGLSEDEIQLILMMAPTRRDEERIQRYIEGSHVDGVILVGSHASDPLPDLLIRRGVPLVLSGRPAAKLDVAYVDVDHRNGAMMAVSHLVAGGRRRIATIHGALDMPSSRDKLDGYCDALAAAGLVYEPGLGAAGNYNPALAGNAMRALLDRNPSLDGVFVASDTMAAAAMGVIGEAGLRIPEDIAVVGYDGTPVAMATRPTLTTVRQPSEAMGQEMARLLLERIEHPSAPPRHVIFSTELIVRESSGSPGCHASRARDR
ncbi:MAG: LacI family transcriptional regulator [Chloroflexales bacterium]|nr:LacI family transcriptional regulator [Chloroflexales bacterium]